MLVLFNLRTPRFIVAIAAIFVALVVVQIAASLLFYRAIDRQTLNNDHARRIAELLVVGDRIHGIAPDRVSGIMTTRYLQAELARAPAIAPGATDRDLSEVFERLIAWEPSLADRALRLARAPGRTGGQDLVGSIRLTDGQWLNFRSLGMAAKWPVATRAITITLATSTVVLAIGLGALLLLSNPLRRMTRAADQIGHGREIEVREEGPRDLRNLAHAMNLMQARIARLLRDQTKSFEAISHDLRTPLSRQKVAAGMVDDQELSEMLLESVDEMDALLESLQTFLRAQTLSAAPETVELHGFVRTTVAAFGDLVRIDDGPAVMVRTYPEPLAMTITALTQNAIQFGKRATIGLERAEDGGWCILIEDEGPGIPSKHHEDILDPFFRLDAARGRDTAGFGLGIPMAHRLMMRFGGGLSFDASRTSGLAVRIGIPTP